ncbi:DNA-3-methyladenine glycosylase [Kushneria phosphatilytica]|uniref:Putative 3-methyladenine DNA glycosylase n=1 Tax=Kushneria phosphatilytica TaxID=657387 RepID=A0A1S1NT13_9GAMM|nr:DNA-3-methyladenine glycosylase [Kushneria phosphatilytica]OHV08432.1 3-methyladenine DNA glycosylase [Kushneria phosphatilytica]QEL09860.1 DNA-3-methyladenine glycosylase [Kushneria phosphatilytica]
MQEPDARPTPLPRSFFARDSLTVARDLMGRELVHDSAEGMLIARIVETEAYGDERDSACHVSRGRTPRNGVLYGPPGHAYVYLIYGLHELLNVVTDADGQPGAVLLRAIVPVHGEAAMIARRNGRAGRELGNGPGKLSQALGITRSAFNRADLCSGQGLWFAAGTPVSDSAVRTGPRVGIDYAEPVDRDAPWRFRLIG